MAVATARRCRSLLDPPPPPPRPASPRPQRGPEPPSLTPAASPRILPPAGALLDRPRGPRGRRRGVLALRGALLLREQPRALGGDRPAAAQQVHPHHRPLQQHHLPRRVRPLQPASARSDCARGRGSERRQRAGAVTLASLRYPSPRSTYKRSEQALFHTCAQLRLPCPAEGSQCVCRPCEPVPDTVLDFFIVPGPRTPPHHHPLPSCLLSYAARAPPAAAAPSQCAAPAASSPCPRLSPRCCRRGRPRERHRLLRARRPPQVQVPQRARPRRPPRSLLSPRGSSHLPRPPSSPPTPHPRSLVHIPSPLQVCLRIPQKAQLTAILRDNFFSARTSAPAPRSGPWAT